MESTRQSSMQAVVSAPEVGSAVAIPTAEMVAPSGIEAVEAQLAIGSTVYRAVRAAQGGETRTGGRALGVVGEAIGALRLAKSVIVGLNGNGPNLGWTSDSGPAYDHCIS